MALSNIRSLTEAEYNSLMLIPFAGEPGVSSIGHPDSAVNIQLGGWVGNSVMAFKITNAAGASSGVSISSDPDTLNVEVTTGSTPSSVTTYWTVDMGDDNRNSDWTLSFAVSKNNTKTGTWVFVKSKVIATDPYAEK